MRDINIEGGRDEFVISCEFILDSQEEYSQIKLLDEISIVIDNDEFLFLVNPLPTRNRNVGNKTYLVKCESKAILLDAPFALPIEREIGPGMASTLMINLAAESGITLVWEIVDWFIPINTLYANSETPLSVIRKVVAAPQGMLQSDPDGTLRALPYYPYPVPEWETQPTISTLSDQQSFFTLSENPEVRPGYNKFTVGDQSTSQSGLRYETKDISDGVKYLFVYEIPWNGQVRDLNHSGGDWVLIEPLGIFEETIQNEQVEIINQIGNTQKPIYNVISREYKQDILGAITFGENGSVKTEVFGQTLVEITYVTKYWKFKITDRENEDVQFWMEDPE